MDSEVSGKLVLSTFNKASEIFFKKNNFPTNIFVYITVTTIRRHHQWKKKLAKIRSGEIGRQRKGGERESNKMRRNSFMRQYKFHSLSCTWCTQNWYSADAKKLPNEKKNNQDNGNIFIYAFHDFIKFIMQKHTILWCLLASRCNSFRHKYLDEAKNWAYNFYKNRSIECCENEQEAANATIKTKPAPQLSSPMWIGIFIHGCLYVCINILHIPSTLFADEMSDYYTLHNTMSPFNLCGWAATTELRNNFTISWK